MCLIAFSWQQHPDRPLVLIGNRDEFHARPSAALARWADAPQLLAGRDLTAGGTWLGVSEHGRLAAVTNVRSPEPAPAELKSRGALASGFLRGQADAQAYVDGLLPEFAGYGACNLLLFDTRQAIFASNQPRPEARALAAGLYGLSNASLDTPWPKTVALREALGGWLQAGRLDDFDPLFDALADEHRAPDAQLPDTGIGVDRERLLASAFIRSAFYGTRASTVVAVDARGRGRMVERRFGPGGVALGEHEARFHWPASAPA